MRRWVIYGTGVVLPEWGVGCQAARTVLCGGRAMKRASLPLRRALGELAAMQRCLLRSKARITAPPGSALQDVIGPDGVNAKVSAIAPIALRGFVCATVDPTD
jgi:hypothetical protein